MLDKIIRWFFYALEVMFFTGLGGCVLVVIISWVTILKDGFSQDS
jgi:hypothetical protein